MNTIAQMNKAELRAACKAAGIQYSKLNTAGQRAALEAKAAEAAAAQAATTDAAAHTAKRHVTNKRGSVGLKIQKGRETRYGVTQPSTGGLCRQVWDTLDSMRTGQDYPTLAEVKQMAAEKKFNVTNAVIEYYRWRKFNNIVGRQA